MKHISIVLGGNFHQDILGRIRELILGGTHGSEASPEGAGMIKPSVSSIVILIPDIA